MNQEQCLKQNILHIRSVKALRGFEWKKRMFKLYHDRIVYLSPDSHAIELGQIALCCITSITGYSEEKNRFDIYLGNYRIYELLSTTTKITNDWTQILRSSIMKYPIKERMFHISSSKCSFWRTSWTDIDHAGFIHNNFGAYTTNGCPSDDDDDDDNDDAIFDEDIGNQSDPGGYAKSLSPPDALPPQNTSLQISKSQHHNKLSVKMKPKRHKRGAQSNNFFNKTNTKTDDNGDNNHKESAQRRLSVMCTSLPSSVDDYTVIESFNYGVFGAVAVVSYSDKAYLLCICNKNDSNYKTSLSVMERMTDLINPYILTQLQRGSSSCVSFSCYYMPSFGNLSHLLSLFGNISLNSVRIIIAEILCALEYLHENNFNFPNLCPNTVFISHRAHVMLTDFGFAIPNNRANAIYREGPLCYAPPEFINQAVDDIKSDWWRLGVLLYHLIVGRPPFNGNAQDIIHQICHSNIDDTLWNKNLYFKQNQDYIFINDTQHQIVKDLVSSLLTRERKNRLGCSQPIKQRKNRHKHKHKHGIYYIMNHVFFDEITKKNKYYPFNWNHLRKREHKAAPVLAHLANRYLYSIQSISNIGCNKHRHEDMYLDDEGSIIDTTDDEEFIISDDEYEEKYMNAQSQSQSTNTLQKTPPDEHYLNETQNSSMSAQSLSISPQQQSPFTNPFHSTLTPLPQSGSSQVHVLNASATPPPTSSSSNVGFINTTMHSSTNTPVHAMTPMTAAFTRKQKPPPNVLPIHRKRLSSRLSTAPIKALPPVPAVIATGISPPPLNHSLPDKGFGTHEPTMDVPGDYDHRFSTYVKHQQSQMNMEMAYHPPPPPHPKHRTPYNTLGVLSPTLNNLPGYNDPKHIDDASTVVSDQIAAAAALRQPILSEKEREKQKKKDKKKSKKKKRNDINIPSEEEIHKKQRKKLPQIETGKKPSKQGLNSIIKGKVDGLFNKKIRSKVSKKKRRFIDKVHGFNLDLTYITTRIIAMGFPSQGKETVYRNPTDEVKRFFNTYHCAKFKVYNLCIEKDRQYPDSKFSDIGGEVARYGFKDHNSPDLELMLRFCMDLQEWFGRDKSNIAAIHCKAGKGRTGVMICAYLAFANICKDATDALEKYGMARTRNAKGVTIPSQRRWVLYFIDYVMNPKICPSPSEFEFYKVVALKRVQINTIPDFDLGGGCDPYFKILNTKGEILYDYSEYHAVKAYKSSKKRKGKRKKSRKQTDTLDNKERVDAIKFPCVDVVLRGAFKIVFYDKDVLSKDDVMCWCWLHSAISSRQKYIKLYRENIDGAVKDKSMKYFAEDFSLEFWFKSPLYDGDDIDDEHKENEPNLRDWIKENMDPRNVAFMRIQNRERRAQNAQYPEYKPSRMQFIEYTNHRAIPPPPPPKDAMLPITRSRTADYDSPDISIANHVKSKSNVPRLRLLNRASEKTPHLEPWKKKLSAKFQKRHSASNIMDQNDTKPHKTHKKAYKVSKNQLIEYHPQKSRRRKPDRKHQSKSKSEYKVSKNTLTEYHPSYTKHGAGRSAPQDSHRLRAIGEHDTDGLDFTGVDYGHVNVDYNNETHNHHKKNKKIQIPHPAMKRNHSEPRPKHNQPNQLTTHYHHNSGQNMNHNAFIPPDINSNPFSNDHAHHRGKSANHKMYTAGDRPRLRLNNNSSHNSHHRHMSANNADKKYKQNNNGSHQRHFSGNRHQNTPSPQHNQYNQTQNQYNNNTSSPQLHNQQYTNNTKKKRNRFQSNPPIQYNPSPPNQYSNSSSPPNQYNQSPPSPYNNSPPNQYQQNQYNTQQQYNNRPVPQQNQHNSNRVQQNQHNNNRVQQNQYHNRPQQHNAQKQYRNAQKPQHNPYNNSAPQYSTNQNRYNNNPNPQRHKHKHHPPSITNTNMMKVLRQNMQHHLSNVDENTYDPNRKTTIV